MEEDFLFIASSVLNRLSVHFWLTELGIRVPPALAFRTLPLFVQLCVATLYAESKNAIGV